MQILNIIQFQNCSYILPFLFFFSFCIYLSMSLPKYHWKVLLDTRLNFITLENAETSEEQVGSYSKRMTSTNWLQHCTEKKGKRKMRNYPSGCVLWLKQSHGWNSRRPPISAAGRHRRWLHRSQGPSSQETHLRRLEIRIFHHGYQPLTPNPTHKIICLHSK